MEEQPNHHRFWRYLLWLPLALLVVLPAVILLAAFYYVRAAVVALWSLLLFLVGYKRPAPSLEAPTQPPHFMDGLAAKKPVDEKRDAT